MCDFKLTYFNAAGRGELTRLIFVKSGTKFEDIRIEAADWPKHKATMPLAQMPILHYRGDAIVQAMVIARFAATKCGLVGKTEMDAFKAEMFVQAIYLDIGNKLIEIIFCKDAAKKAALIEERRQPTKDAFGRLGNLVKGEFVLGDVMSYADLALMDVASWLEMVMPEVELPVKLQSVVDKVKADPKIAAYQAAQKQKSG